MTSDKALLVRARERPEAPFVFFRGRRGHFRWLSYAAAASGGGLAADGPEWAPPEVHELVRYAVELPPGAPGSDGGAPFVSTDAGRRDVWISWRALHLAAEGALVAAAVRGGAAIVVERRDAFPVDLFLWARPTVVSATLSDLCAIVAGVEREAPRFRRGSWLRQKLGRLRLALVEGPAAPAEVGRLAAELRRVLPGAGTELRASATAAGPVGPALV